MIYCDSMGHMISDTSLDELHSFAKEIGLKREWFQDKVGHPHYDLMGIKKQKAIDCGAKLVTAKELIKILQAQK